MTDTCLKVFTQVVIMRLYLTIRCKAVHYFAMWFFLLQFTYSVENTWNKIYVMTFFTLNSRTGQFSWNGNSVVIL